MKSSAEEEREAAREFLLEHIPDQLDFALNPDTREMTHRMMADFSLERQQSALRDIQKYVKKHRKHTCQTSDCIDDILDYIQQLQQQGGEDEG